MATSRAQTDLRGLRFPSSCRCGDVIVIAKCTRYVVVRKVPLLPFQTINAGPQGKRDRGKQRASRPSKITFFHT
jgi:hypothetical protein